MLKALFSLLSREKEQASVWQEGDKLREDRILNYLWINSDRCRIHKMLKPDVVSSVPLHYIDKAHENARKYPDTEVRIWLDYKLFDDETRVFVDTHHYLNAPPNVRLMNVQDIPRYAACPAMDEKEHIWERVDLARFMVIDHCFKTTRADQVFYADFDVEDVQLDNKRTRRILEKTGAAYAQIPERCMMAHGYIAMDRSHADRLDMVMLPKLEEVAIKGDSVYRELKRMVLGPPRIFGPAFPYTSITNVPVHGLGYYIPANPDYESAKICGTAFRL